MTVVGRIARLSCRFSTIDSTPVDASSPDDSRSHAPCSNRSSPATGTRLPVLTALLIALIGPILAGCLSDTDFGPVAPRSDPLTPFTVASRLEPGDKLKIVVYGEDTLSGLYEISPNGTITMPLVGAVRVGDLTRQQIETTLADAFARGGFLREPKVTIADVAYRPIYVLGEVQTPGKYPYTIGLDVLTAVATAGGFTYRGSNTSVLIRHENQYVWQRYSLATPLPVAPGDLIRVLPRYF